MITSHGSLATTLNFQVKFEKDVKRKYADFILILGAKKGAVHLIPSQNAFF